MKIVSLDFEIIRATPAVAEFLVHVEIDNPVMGYEVVGRAVGPRCPGVSTVEVAYSMNAVRMSDNRVSLRCVFPEPNMWTCETPFTYSVTVDLRRGDEVVATRSGAVKFRGN
jgi:hypothetical protein